VVGASFFISVAMEKWVMSVMLLSCIPFIGDTTPRVTHMTHTQSKIRINENKTSHPRLNQHSIRFTIFFNSAILASTSGHQTEQP